MNRFGQRLRIGLVAASLALCIFISVIWTWTMLGGGLASGIWHVGNARYMIYVEPCNIGFSATSNWPYSVHDPGWVMPNSGLELPVLTAIVCLAIPSFLKFCESASTAPLRKMKAMKGVAALIVGVVAFAWFVLLWLNSMSDDQESWIAGSFGIAVPVILIWLGSRQLIGLRSKSPKTGF
jgi:hypothetical protein